MLPSTNMSLCCVSNIHLPFQLSYMLIWDKANNHGNGSNASQTHMLEKHHHWGSALCRYDLLGLPTGLQLLKHPTNSQKCVSKQIIFPIFMKIYTQIWHHQSGKRSGSTLIKSYTSRWCHFKDKKKACYLRYLASVSNIFFLDRPMFAPYIPHVLAAVSWTFLASTWDPYKPSCFI